jgi:hypothetical protein
VCPRTGNSGRQADPEPIHQIQNSQGQTWPKDQTRPAVRSIPAPQAQQRKKKAQGGAVDSVLRVLPPAQQSVLEGLRRTKDPDDAVLPQFRGQLGSSKDDQQTQSTTEQSDDLSKELDSSFECLKRTPSQYFHR